MARGHHPLVHGRACLACALRFRRTVVELLSARWDAEVTRTLRHRFLGEPSEPRA